MAAVFLAAVVVEAAEAAGKDGQAASSQRHSNSMDKSRAHLSPAFLSCMLASDSHLPVTSLAFLRIITVQGRR